MSTLGVVIVVILVLILLGGVGPTFYSGAPWRLATASAMAGLG